MRIPWQTDSPLYEVFSPTVGVLLFSSLQRRIAVATYLDSKVAQPKVGVDENSARTG